MTIERSSDEKETWVWPLWRSLHTFSSLNIFAFSDFFSCSSDRLLATLHFWQDLGLPLRFYPEHLVSLATIGEFWVDTARLSSVVGHPIVSFVSCTSTQDLALSSRAILPVLIFWSEYQHRGRGRQQRAWLSPISTGLTFSLRCTGLGPVCDLNALSLVVSLCILEVLHALGCSTVRLKWPNDLLLMPSYEKVSGVLVECSHDAVVVGVGINMKRLFPCLVPGDLHGRRVAVFVSLIGKLLSYIEIFNQQGFSFFKTLWVSHCLFQSSYICVRTQRDVCGGWFAGIDDSGALLLFHPGQGTRRFLSGDVLLCRSHGHDELSCD